MVKRLHVWAVGTALGLISLTPPVAAAADGVSSRAGEGPVTVAVMVDGSSPTRVARPSVRRFTAPSERAARGLIEDLEADEAVLSADIDHRMHATAVDTYRSLQWGLTTVHAEAAWASST